VIDFGALALGLLLLLDPQAAPSVTRPAESTTAPARLVKIRELVIGLLFQVKRSVSAGSPSALPAAGAGSGMRMHRGVTRPA
jgi:hypothetical protein